MKLQDPQIALRLSVRHVTYQVKAYMIDARNSRSLWCLLFTHALPAVMIDYDCHRTDV